MDTTTNSSSTYEEEYFELVLYIYIYFKSKFTNLLSHPEAKLINFLRLTHSLIHHLFILYIMQRNTSYSSMHSMHTSSSTHTKRVARVLILLEYAYLVRIILHTSSIELGRFVVLLFGIITTAVSIAEA